MPRGCGILSPAQIYLRRLTAVNTKCAFPHHTILSEWTLFFLSPSIFNAYSFILQQNHLVLFVLNRYLFLKPRLLAVLRITTCCCVSRMSHSRKSSWSRILNNMPGDFFVIHLDKNIKKSFGFLVMGVVAVERSGAPHTAMVSSPSGWTLGFWKGMVCSDTDAWLSREQQSLEMSVGAMWDQTLRTTTSCLWGFFIEAA